MMNKEILDILACPECKGDLKIESAEKDTTEIINGRLICETCGLFFTIQGGVPNFLDADSKTP